MKNICNNNRLIVELLALDLVSYFKDCSNTYSVESVVHTPYFASIHTVYIYGLDPRARTLSHYFQRVSRPQSVIEIDPQGENLCEYLASNIEHIICSTRREGGIGLAACAYYIHFVYTHRTALFDAYLYRKRVVVRKGVKTRCNKKTIFGLPGSTCTINNIGYIDTTRYCFSFIL